MRGVGSQLALDFGGSAGPVSRLRTARKVPREAIVRLVEYAPFPRVQRDLAVRRGVTLDLSSRGLCLRAEEAAPEGSLLHVLVRSVDGRPQLDALARVVWSAPGPAGGARMGLELVAVRGGRTRPAAPHLRLAVAAST
jgi:hypothetical protein